MRTQVVQKLYQDWHPIQNVYALSAKLFQTKYKWIFHTYKIHVEAYCKIESTGTAC